MKQIFILSSCNEWKEHASKSLVMATTSPRKLKSGIIQEIKVGNMEYNNGNEKMSKTAQCKLLNKDYAESGEQFVFDNLEFGYVEVVNDGEIQ